MKVLKPDLLLREGACLGLCALPVLDAWAVITLLMCKPLLLAGVLGQQMAIVAPALIRVDDRAIRSYDPDKLG
jgi:hypothetical protein